MGAGKDYVRPADKGRRPTVGRLVAVILSAVLFLAVFGRSLGSEPEGKASYAASVKGVSSLRELEQALSASGEMTIHLNSDITVNRCLKVRGKKELNGSGRYRLRRKSTAGGTYRGTMLLMQGTELRLRNITLCGSGKSKTVSGNVNGRLIEVSAGTVTLESGATLCENYNLSSFTDGGGGITVHRGGKAVMRAGSAIRDNLTITGGSGVRVEAGGTFVMDGGTIADNAVRGQRTDTGFDGRGGAIHNRGIVQLRQGSITGNMAVGYKSGGETYGGFGGAVYNQNVVTVTGGVMRNNRADFAGGAIYTNEKSIVCISNGVIERNSSSGQRGGGIYLSAGAVVQIDGGTIADNTADDGTQIFIASNSTGRLQLNGGRVSGGGDVVYNNGGRFLMGGGLLEGRDVALRTKGRSEIRGGTVRGDRYGIYDGGGTLLVSGKPKIGPVYLKEGQRVDVDRRIRLQDFCELCPESYQDGVKLVDIESGETPEVVQGSFKLRKKKHYILETGPGGLYVGREKYTVIFHPNGGQGSMKSQRMYVGERKELPLCVFWRPGYGFAGWGISPGIPKAPGDILYRERVSVKDLGTNGDTVTLYALWVRRPEISCGEEAVFYEGEYVTEDVLRKGMKAEDERDGDLTDSIELVEIILPDTKKAAADGVLPTGEGALGKGEILYRVTNSFGVSGEYRRGYEVLPNGEPEITAEDRYYFVGEYNMDSAAGKQDVLAGFFMKDDVETEQQLQKAGTVLWGGLDFGKAGEYPVTVRIRDQYGHRFYMAAGEERKYGTGKACERSFTVHVVERLNQPGQDEKPGYVRFISGEYRDTLLPDSVWRSEPYAGELARTFRKGSGDAEEVWTISAGDRRRIKAFIREQENPFSRESNRGFLQEFSGLRRDER